MSRAQGRRVAVKKSRRPRSDGSRRYERPLTESTAPGWAWLGVVVVAVASLLVAGLAPDPELGLADSESADTQVTRTLHCSGGIPQSRAHLAVSVGERLRSVKAAAKAKTIEVAADAETAAVASQSSVDGRGRLAFAACPEPRAGWWFVGASATQGTYSKLILDNPRAGVAVVNIRVLGVEGEVEAPGLQGISLAAGERKQFDLRKFAPASGELAVRVVAQRGLVVANMVDNWKASPLGKKQTNSEWIAPQPEADQLLTLTGIPANSRSASLVVANTQRGEARVKVRIIGADGSFSPQGMDDLKVPPRSVAAFNVEKAFDGKPLSLQISANTNVVATVRSTVDEDQTYAVAGEPLAGTAALALSPGNRAFAQFAVTGEETTATIQAYSSRGKALGKEVAVAVAADTSAELPLQKKAAYVEVTVPEGASSLVAGLVVRRPGGVGGTAFSIAAEPGLSPDVRPRW